MKAKWAILFSALLALLGAGCVSSRVAVVEHIASLGEAPPQQTRFVLNEEFWVYFYPKPIATFSGSGIPLSLRMTAASTGRIGGRDREFLGILPAGSQLNIWGAIRRKGGLSYVVEVEATEEKGLQGAFIEIYSGRKNYSRQGHDMKTTRLNEALFGPPNN
ncbi:hypothetical protein [Cephaloticoccus primus]|uniref:hypothetical protein n=1 Tax=Cephaloticoccus primus TaxID=1548207 RepID=UPI0012E7FA75|nr:hypothetical protein [Cephaloticoccus primus]